MRNVTWAGKFFEHADPPFIDEEIVDDMDKVENKVSEIQMRKIDNVITDDEINNDIDDKEEELLSD